MNAMDPVRRRSGLDATLQSRAAPLPVSSYFDPAWFARERSLFETGPNYVGSEMMVPGIGDYMALPWTGSGKVLVHGPGGVNLLSNACRHRQGLLLEGRGHGANIVCPLHRWTYDLDGRLLGAPGFEVTPDCSLPKTPLQRWNGLLFAGPRDAAADLADFPLAAEYDYGRFVLDKVTVEECPFNWKAFLEIFVEMYHVEAIHPGLRAWVDAGGCDWSFGDRWSCQVLGTRDGLRSQASPNYARYRDALLAHGRGEVPEHGAIWSVLYPNVMLEWYPQALVVSTAIPRSPEHTTNVVEFYYPEDVRAFERELVEAHQAAYAESAAEDAEACARLHRGRRALWLAGEDAAGPYQTPHEDGVMHMHDWIRRELALRLPD